MAGSPISKIRVAHFATTSAKKDTAVMDPFAGKNVPLASVMMELTAANQRLTAVVLVTRPMRGVCKKLQFVRKTVFCTIQFAMTVSTTLAAVSAPLIANSE